MPEENIKTKLSVDFLDEQYIEKNHILEQVLNGYQNESLIERVYNQSIRTIINKLTSIKKSSNFVKM